MRHDRGVLSRGRWLLAAVLLACCALGVFAPAARADGDPGSDVLVYQNLFVAADVEHVHGTAGGAGRPALPRRKPGFPIRVAIISPPDDLGAITALWDKPAAYASFLGTELSLVYAQRLLIVMPNGFGFNWTGHPLPRPTRCLTGAHRPGRDGLATAAVRPPYGRSPHASGIRLARPPQRGERPVRTACSQAPASRQCGAVGGQRPPRGAAECCPVPADRGASRPRP